MKSPDWIIHYVNDGRCGNCGKVLENQAFLPGMCDAHTHGLDKYGFELQFVLDCPPDFIGYILNEVARRIKEGLVLHNGDLIEGVFSGNAMLKVFETKDFAGKKIFRLVIPDREFKFPEESSVYPYNMQYENPYRSGKES